MLQGYFHLFPLNPLFSTFKYFWGSVLLLKGSRKTDQI